MDAEIDLIPTASLPDRYGVKLPGVYARLKALSIETQKVGRASYITANDLKRLDKLDTHLQAGGNINEFTESDETSLTRLSVSSLKPVKTGEDASMTSMNLMNQLDLVQSIVDAIARGVKPQPDPLGHIRGIQEACDQGWILGTTEVAALLKMSRRSLSGHPHIERYGFRFTKCGNNGVEAAWRIEKLSH